MLSYICCFDDATLTLLPTEELLLDMNDVSQTDYRLHILFMT